MTLSVLSCLLAVGFLFRYHPKPKLEFIDIEQRVQGDLYIRFRLINDGRYDHHYQIHTDPSLVSHGAAAAMGLLSAGSITTNRIPVDFVSMPFRLVADCYRIPILSVGWYRRPRHAWRCLLSFGRGESRLLYSYPDELTKHRVFRVKTPVVSVDVDPITDHVEP